LALRVLIYKAAKKRDYAAQIHSLFSRTYSNLTGKHDGFAAFKTLMDQKFPPGTSSNLDTDNPFPL